MVFSDFSRLENVTDFIWAQNAKNILCTIIGLKTRVVGRSKNRFKLVQGIPVPSDFTFEINVGKRRIRHRTTLNLNDVIFDRF